VWKKGSVIESDVNNYRSFPITPSFINRLTSQFEPTEAGITLRNELIDAPNIMSGTIGFKDPWLIDFNDAPYGLRNQGMSAPFYQRSSPFAPDLTTAYPVQSGSATYKGVFLNQGQDPSNPQPPYYSARAQSTQTIGGYTGDFLGWAGVGATPSSPANLETPVVFTAPNAVVSARYKGRLLSSLPDATGNSGQRRLMRVQDGTLFFVYESAGQIWITHSTDGGNTWQPDRRLGEGKNPSLADAELGRVLAVWLNPNYINPTYQTVERRIQACLVGAGTIDPVQSVPYHSDYLSPTLDARPVAIRQQFTYGSTAVFFEFNDNNEMNQGQRTGLAYAVATDNYVSNWTWNPFTDHVSGSFVSGFDRSLNPTITQYTSMGSQSSGLNHNFGLAWVAAGIDGTGAIKYAEMKFTSTQPYKPTLHLPLLTFTQGSYQSSPSITSTPLIANAQNVAHHKFLTWTGVHNYSPRSIFYLRIPEGNYVNYPATVITSPNGYAFSAPSIRFESPTGEKVVLTYQAQDPVSDGTLRPIQKSIVTNGYWTHASTGIVGRAPNAVPLGAEIFAYTENSAAPRRLKFKMPTGGRGETQNSVGGKGQSVVAITQSNHSGGGEPDEIFFESIERISGRLATQDDSGFLELTLADVGLNGNARTGLTYHDLGANLLPDTLALSPSNVFSLLKSRRFTLSDTINQVSATVKVHSKHLYDLTQNNPVQLAVELVNATTGSSIALSQTALVTASDTAKDLHFTMNLPTGQAGTEVELRVKVLGFAIQTSHKASALNEIELVNATGGAAIVNRVGGQAAHSETIGSVPTQFALHQNYPNPFNPTTVIRYELPSNAMVKVQVFDVLGRVVSTVVNEQKEAGIYEAVFNASGLSSGTYFYRLQAGTFVETKKMVLIK
jgi:hypothetical protein